MVEKTQVEWMLCKCICIKKCMRREGLVSEGVSKRVRKLVKGGIEISFLTNV